MAVGCLTYGCFKTYFHEGAPEEIKRSLAKSLSLITPNPNPEHNDIVTEMGFPDGWESMPLWQ
jgi:hypothetical protein